MISSSMVINILVSILIGASAGYLGSLMIGRKMSLTAGPLGHLALPGIALALMLRVDIFWGALFSTILGALIIWSLEESGLHVETLTGIVFAFIVALGFLILPLEEAEKAVVGDIAAVGSFDLVLGIAITLITFLVLRRIYDQIVLSSLSRSLAKSEGVKSRVIELSYLLVIALVVAFEVKIVGILLTAALFILPSSAARVVTGDMSRYKMLSVLFGILSTVIGYFVYVKTGLPAGPLMILSASLIFFGSLATKRLI